MAGGPAPVELSADCTTCGLEAGVVELYDALVPACRFGLPATSRCKLCGIQHEGAFDRAPARDMREVPANRCPACVTELGPRALDDRRCAKCGAAATLTLVAPAASLDSEAALVAALDAWAAREEWALARGPRRGGLLRSGSRVARAAHRPRRAARGGRRSVREHGRSDDGRSRQARPARADVSATCPSSTSRSATSGARGGARHAGARDREPTVEPAAHRHAGPEFPRRRHHARSALGVRQCAHRSARGAARARAPCASRCPLRRSPPRTRSRR